MRRTALLLQTEGVEAVKGVASVVVVVVASSSSSSSSSSHAIV